MGRFALRWLEHAFALFGVLVALFWLTLNLTVVVSTSMSPTLQGTSFANGDRVLTEKVSFWFRRPQRWEIITFVDKSGETRMKRVAGLPGESVQIQDRSELLIDGQPVAVPRAYNRKYLRYGNLTDGKPVPCGEGYYVLGDALKDSDDSRFNGTVSPAAIIGRAWLLLSPRDRFGRIE